MDPKCVSNERYSSDGSSSSNISGTSLKNPNLEFTLGNSVWCLSCDWLIISTNHFDINILSLKNDKIKS